MSDTRVGFTSFALFCLTGLSVAHAQAPRAMNMGTATTAVASNGLTFPVTDAGRGPAVLLLHGFPDDRHM